jgi:hypothetical protein
MVLVLSKLRDRAMKIGQDRGSPTTKFSVLAPHRVVEEATREIWPTLEAQIAQLHALEHYNPDRTQ